MALAGGGKKLLPRGLQPHAAAPQLIAEPGVQRLVEHVLLVAEAAADIGLDHPHLAPGQAQSLADDPAHDVRDLGGADHAKLAPLHPGKGHGGFDMAMLHGLRAVAAAQIMQVCGVMQAFPVPGLVAVLLEQVGGANFLMQGHSRRGQGGLGVGVHGQLLIIHPNQAQGPLGGHLVHRHHHGHVVPHIAHMGVEQAAVPHILVIDLRGPGVTRGGEAVLRHVKAGEYPLHPGQGRRLGDIHGAHQAVAHGAVQHLGGQGLGRAQVVAVFGRAGDLVPRVHPRHAFADNIRVSHIPVLLK